MPRAKTTKQKLRESEGIGISGKKRVEFRRDEQPDPPPERHDDKCPVCNHPDKALIEAAYMDMQENNVIAAMFRSAEYDFTQYQLQTHAENYDMHNERALNSNVIMRIIKERGVAAIRSGEVQIKPELLAKVAMHTDEKEGRMPSRAAEDHGVQTLVLAAWPGPGGILPLNTVQQALPAPVTPPSTVPHPEQDVIDVDAEVVDG